MDVKSEAVKIPKLGGGGGESHSRYLHLIKESVPHPLPRCLPCLIPVIASRSHINGKDAHWKKWKIVILPKITKLR